MNRRIFAWALYDFANTPLTVAMGGLFLAQWVVLDNHLDDIWYGGAFTIATVFLLLTSPFWGAWSDKLGQRMPFLKWTTVVLVVVGVLMGLVSTATIDRGVRVMIVLGLFLILQYVYQVSLIFYNALLGVLAKRDDWGKVSGVGEAFSELGWLLGPLMLLPFSLGVTLLGESGRGQVFLPAAAVLVLFGLPLFLWLKEPKAEMRPRTDFRAVYRETIEGFKNLIRHDRNVTLFLVAFMFVSDALLTANLYFAVYLDQIFRMTDVQKGLLLVVMEVVAVVSSLVFGRLSDRLGNKWLLVLSCLNLVLTYGVMAFMSVTYLAYLVAAFAGFGYGVFYTTSRTLLVRISPAKQLGEYFGFFSTFQKFASIVGPLTWGVVTLLLKDYGAVKYRVAVFSLSLLMLVGTLLMTQVHERRASTP